MASVVPHSTAGRRDVHPGVFAAREPERPAVIVGAAGPVVTYAELDARSNQVAWLARCYGLRPGDGLAAIMENRPELFDLAWGAQRSGLQFTAVNWHLTAEEAGYLATDSGARVVVASSRLADLAGALGPVLGPDARRLMIGGTIPGWDAFEDAVGELPTTPVPDECEGDIMLYSSGTTGRPKGIKRPAGAAPFGAHPDIPGHWLRELLGLAEGEVYLSPAPLYHAAPLAWSMSCHRTGATPSEYHGDPAKTAAAANERGWRTVGDVGYLDRDGYLYLTDRAGNLIISGGVNIYPQEIENVLTMHPDVLDAAVLGVPDPEMGEQVKAVVQVRATATPEQRASADEELAERLGGYCREHLAGFKCPRSFEFTAEELRTPVGKIRRGPLRERFGATPGTYHPSR